MTAPPEDWSAYTDIASLVQAANERSPIDHPHGLLLEDAPGSFSWGWYWFVSAAERTAWVRRNLELEPDSADGGNVDVVIEDLQALGEGPADESRLMFHLGDSEAAWIGTFDQLRRGSDPGSRKCRRDFWEVQREDEDENSEPTESELEAPIPDEHVDDFIQSLYPS